MGNTIARPRRRPRQHSVNFRALWWLARVEAWHCLRVRDEAQLLGEGRSRAETLQLLGRQRSETWRWRASLYAGRTYP